MNAPLNIATLSPTTIAIFDHLSDGEWHTTSSILDAIGPICAATEYASAHRNGTRALRRSIASGKTHTDETLAHFGARDIVRNRLMIAVRAQRLERNKTHHKMTAQACAEWAALQAGNLAPTEATAATHNPVADQNHVAPSPAPATESTPVTAPVRERHLVFGDIDETDGFTSVPLRLTSRVHFRIDYDTLTVTELRNALPGDHTATYDATTGIFRVDCPHGQAAHTRTLINTWCAENGHAPKGMRIEADVRRRTVGDLPADFLADLCTHYQRYLRGWVGRNRNILDYHFAEDCDRDQQVVEWILDAASRYDQATGVPFGAFLIERLSRWVHDLNRTKYGRVLADAELKQRRVTRDFAAASGRIPTQAEMAELLGEAIETTRKNSVLVAQMGGLRHTKSYEDEAVSERYLDSGENITEGIEAAAAQTAVAQAITRACTVDPTAKGKLSTTPNVLGFVALYESMFARTSKAALAASMNTSVRNMNDYSNRAEERLRGSSLRDLVTG